MPDFGWGGDTERPTPDRYEVGCNDCDFSSSFDNKTSARQSKSSHESPTGHDAYFEGIVEEDGLEEALEAASEGLEEAIVEANDEDTVRELLAMIRRLDEVRDGA